MFGMQAGMSERNAGACKTGQADYFFSWQAGPALVSKYDQVSQLSKF